MPQAMGMGAQGDAERHDYYIGQALYRELRGNPDE
jgi:hypothetical protein